MGRRFTGKQYIFFTISIKGVDGGDGCDEVTGEEGRDFGQVLKRLADLGEQDAVVLHQTVDQVTGRFTVAAMLL